VPYPITVDEALDHLRLSRTDVTDNEWEEIERMIAAATGFAESFCRRRFTPATLVEYFDRFPYSTAAALHLPNGIVSSVDSVTYFTVLNAPAVWAPENYRVWSPKGRSYLLPAVGGSWPKDSTVAPGHIEVTYTVGSGDSVPDPVRSAILLVVGSLYEYREDGVIDNAGLALVRAPMSARDLLSPYKMSL
jgi:uncharacterized phiE125 gp8 family phage protein